MDETTLLRLLTWLSPSYPVGAYSYSHGLEWAIEAGVVRDRNTLRDWIEGVLEAGSGWSDAVLFCHSYETAKERDVVRYRELRELAAALPATAELYLETMAQGAAFVRVTLEAWPDEEGCFASLCRGEPAVSYPGAVAAAVALHGLPVRPGLIAYLHAFAANLVSAGVRLLPLGQTDGQRVTAALLPLIERVTERAIGAELQDATSFHPHRRLVLHVSRNPIHEAFPLMSTGPLRVGIGGPVGSGKTMLCECLCKSMSDRWEMAVVTNDIYTKEDQRLLIEAGALAPERIMGVETGGCPHTAIREDASINLAAIAAMQERFTDLELILIESGGDNLAATFSPELADLTVYVIDVAGGEKIPRKGGPGITRSDLLVINKVDLAPSVGASLAVMAADTKRMRGERPFVMTNLRAAEGLSTVVDFIIREGGLPAR